MLTMREIERMLQIQLNERSMRARSSRKDERMVEVVANDHLESAAIVAALAALREASR